MHKRFTLASRNYLNYAMHAYSSDRSIFAKAPSVVYSRVSQFVAFSTNFGFMIIHLGVTFVIVVFRDPKSNSWRSGGVNSDSTDIC